MAKRSFSPELLESLRSMVVTKALDALGLHWKRDQDFQPVKDAATLRLHVAVGGGVWGAMEPKTNVRVYHRRSVPSSHAFASTLQLHKSASRFISDRS